MVLGTFVRLGLGSTARFCKLTAAAPLDGAQGHKLLTQGRVDMRIERRCEFYVAVLFGQRVRRAVPVHNGSVVKSRALKAMKEFVLAVGPPGRVGRLPFGGQRRGQQPFWALRQQGLLR